MYNYNTDSLGLILGVEVFFLVVTVQEHCDQHFLLYDMDFLKSNGLVDKLSCHLLTTMIF